jgi:hypothetical protein
VRIISQLVETYFEAPKHFFSFSFAFNLLLDIAGGIFLYLILNQMSLIKVRLYSLKIRGIENGPQND